MFADVVNGTVTSGSGNDTFSFSSGVTGSSVIGGGGADSVTGVAFRHHASWWRRNDSYSFTASSALLTSTLGRRRLASSHYRRHDWNRLPVVLVMTHLRWVLLVHWLRFIGGAGDSFVFGATVTGASIVGGAGTTRSMTSPLPTWVGPWTWILPSPIPTSSVQAWSRHPHFANNFPKWYRRIDDCCDSSYGLSPT